MSEVGAKLDSFQDSPVEADQLHADVIQNSQIGTARAHVVRVQSEVRKRRAGS